MQRSPTIVSPSQQRLHKSQFLQKLSCQKPCWDQARLSGLVNKQVAPDLLCGGHLEAPLVLTQSMSCKETTLYSADQSCRKGRLVQDLVGVEGGIFSLALFISISVYLL